MRLRAVLLLCACTLALAIQSVHSGDAPAPEGETDFHKGVLGIVFKPGPAETDAKYKHIETSLRSSLKRAMTTPLIADVKVEQVELAGSELQKDAEDKKAGWVFELNATFAILKKGKDKDGNPTFTVSCQVEQTAFLRDKSSWKPVLSKNKPAPIIADTPGPVPMTNLLAEPLHDALVPIKLGPITKRDQPRDKSNYQSMHIYTLTFTVTNKLPFEINSVYPLVYSTAKKPQPGDVPGRRLVGVSKVTQAPIKPGATATIEGIVEGYLADDQVVWPPQRIVSSTTLKF